MASDKKTIVHSLHAVTLRVDEMVDGEVAGSKIAKKVGEFSVERGLTEVDADLWEKWYEQNKGGALVTSGAVGEHKREREEDGQNDSGGGEAGGGDSAGAGGPHAEQGAVRDGGVEAADEPATPALQADGEAGPGPLRDGD